MCCRKTESSDYTLSNYNTFYLILKQLQKKYQINELWVVEEGGSNSRKYDESISIYNIFSFNHFGELIDILEPDLVISIGGDFEYLERSMLKAAASRGIPSVDITSTVVEKGYFTKEYSTGILSGRINALKDHGKNILKKYSYLVKTLYGTGYGIGYILKTFAKDVYLPLTTFVPRYNFGGGSINIVSTPSWIEFLERKGICRDSIVVTGECSMDAVYEKLAIVKQGASEENRIKTPGTPTQILFITSPMVEHGYWKPEMRNECVLAVIKSVKKEFGKEVYIRIKIHPVSEKLEFYRKLIESVDPNIEIIQKADLISLIAESDIIIGFGATSAYFQAMLLRKPLILVNFFNEDSLKNIYFREKIAIECKNTDELVDCIRKRSSIQITDENLDNIIEKVFYKFDGKCSERAADQIITLLKKYNKIMF